jgi:hypothetical protein
MRCHKALYGAREAPRMWHDLLHNWFVTEGYTTNPQDPCLYSKWDDNGVPLHCLVHVDDVLIVGPQDRSNYFKQELSKAFDVTGGDPISKYLGMEFKRTDDGFEVTQKYITDNLLARTGQLLANQSNEQVPMRAVRLDKTTSPVSDEDKAKWKEYPFRSILGAIGYIMLGIAPQLAHAYGQLARFNDCYGKQHWDALLELLGYIRANRDKDVFCIGRGAGNQLSCYTDADWNASYDSKSTTGWVCFLGSTPISWCSRLQKATSLSTAQAEYISLSSAAQECAYLQMLMESLRSPTPVVRIVGKYRQGDPDCTHEDNSKCKCGAVKIWCDSKNAVQEANKPANWVSNQLRHIKTGFHFLRGYIQDGLFQLDHVPGDANCADICTKGWGKGLPGTINQRAQVWRKHADFCLGKPSSHGVHGSSLGRCADARHERDDGASTKRRKLSAAASPLVA